MCYTSAVGASLDARLCVRNAGKDIHSRVVLVFFVLLPDERGEQRVTSSFSLPRSLFGLGSLFEDRRAVRDWSCDRSRARYVGEAGPLVNLWRGS